MVRPHDTSLFLLKREKISERQDFADEVAKKDAEPKRRASFNGLNKSGEAQVVFGAQLAEILKEWRDLWELERTEYEQSSYGRPAGSGVMGPTQYISTQTGIDRRRVSGIVNGEWKFIPLSQADAVLSAIGKDYLIGGFLHVIPNPNWSMESWVEYMKERGCF